MTATPASASHGACSARSRTASRRPEPTRSTAINSACRSRTSAYAREQAELRSSFQLIQKKLADAHAAAALGLLGVIQLGRMKDAGTWARASPIDALVLTVRSRDGLSA